MMALRGVRSSWLMLARKSDLGAIGRLGLSLRPTLILAPLRPVPCRVARLPRREPVGRCGELGGNSRVRANDALYTLALVYEDDTDIGPPEIDRRLGCSRIS